MPLIEAITPASLLVRTGGAAAVVPAARTRLRTYDSGIVMTSVHTLPQLIERAS